MSFVLSDLETPTKNKKLQNAEIEAESQEIQRQLDSTIEEIHELTNLATVYSRNTSLALGDMTLSEIDRKKREKEGHYKRSPFGKDLHISDYSPFVSPSRSPYRKKVKVTPKKSTQVPLE